jgi:signal peptide peptidase SppA
MTPQQTERIKLFMDSPLWAIRLDLDLFNRPVLAAAEIAALKPEQKSARAHKIMVIPVKGVLSREGDMGSSYGMISDALEHAAADPDVKRIVLHVDSPGGEVKGLPETATLLAQVARIKPVSAMVDGQAASAAYWLASQASDITISPSAEVGSVGVKVMHTDISKMLADQGIKITELYAGDFKTEFSPYKPLSDDALGAMQTRLAGVHNDFIKAVAEGRGGRTSTKLSAAGFGGGRMFTAGEAVGNGLADKIQGPREFYRSLNPAEETASKPVDYGLARRRIAVERARV